MTTYLGKSCSFCLPRVPFVNCRQFMYLVFPFWFWGQDIGSDCISSWSLLIFLLFLPTCLDARTVLPRHMLINAWLIPSCLDALTSLPRNMMINTRLIPSAVSGSEQVGIRPVLIMSLGMAGNVSEKVGMSQIKQPCIQSCGSALVR